MAEKNCQACADLTNDAPNLIVNGIGTTEINSLKNNTGLNPSNNNDDCEDLNNMNDCLIGNLEDEIDAYDVCDWKEFTKNFVNNTWTVLKGIIAAICGLWTNVKNLWKEVDKINDMCRLIEQLVSPNVPTYGTLPLATSEAQIARRCGTATNKVVARPDDGTLNPYTKHLQNIGLYYAKMTVESCSSSRSEMLEWIAPSTTYYRLKAGVQSGDVLWKITKSEAQSVLGMSDHLWTAFTQSNFTWTEVALTNRRYAWIKVAVGTDGLSSNEMGVIYMGTSYPNDPITEDTEMINLGAESSFSQHSVSE